MKYTPRLEQIKNIDEVAGSVLELSPDAVHSGVVPFEYFDQPGIEMGARVDPLVALADDLAGLLVAEASLVRPLGAKRVVNVGKLDDAGRNRDRFALEPARVRSEERRVGKECRL